MFLDQCGQKKKELEDRVGGAEGVDPALRVPHFVTCDVQKRNSRRESVTESAYCSCYCTYLMLGVSYLGSTIVALLCYLILSLFVIVSYWVIYF